MTTAFVPKLVDGYLCGFVEDHGKDISFERWRLSLYYCPGFAHTKFFTSEKDKQTFMASLLRLPGTYTDYKRTWKPTFPQPKPC